MTVGRVAPGIYEVKDGAFANSLLNPILPVFILPLHLKDAFVHELFVMVIFSGSSPFIEAISSKTKSLNPYAQSEDKTTYTIRIF